MQSVARVPVLAWAIENLVDIAIALGVAAGIVVLLYGLRALVLRACKQLGPQHPFAEVLLDAARRTRLWFMVALALELVEGYLHPPPDVAKTVTFLFTVATAFQAAIWARALVMGVIEARTGHDEEESRALASAFGIIRLLVSVAVFAIAGVVVLDNLGVNVTGLVAGLGIGGIAIGLAAQGIFSDLFAALSIIFDKPFRVGDTINYQGKEGPVTGTVKQIGLKSTRILSLTGELRIIGNTQLLAQEVTNFAGRQMFRFSLPVGVIYQTDPAVLAQIPDLLKAEVESRGHRYVNAWLRAFGPSSIDFDFLFEVDEEDSGLANKQLEAVALGVLRTFADRGIEFAYPTQTTFTAAPDGTMIMPYPQVMPVVDRTPEPK
jgi:small-conductance mechanosensitive channel